MTNQFRRLCECAALLLLAATTTPSHAQRVGVSALAISTNEQLIGDPLVGVSGGLAFPIRDSRVALRFALDWATGTSTRIGVACGGGLVPPGTCEERESLRDRTRWLAVSGGLSVDVVRSRSAAFAIAGSIFTAPVSTETRGESTGRSLRGSESTWGGTLGLEGRWRPSPSMPLWIEGAADVGGGALLTGIVVDGYNPYGDGIDFRRFRLGMSWDFSPRR